MKDRKAPRDNAVSETWDTLPWRKLEQHCYRIQKRIYRASQSGKTRAGQKLQKLLLKSEAARLIAVRRATQDNRGKNTAGVDGVKTVPPSEHHSPLLRPKGSPCCCAGGFGFSIYNCHAASAVVGG